MSRNKKPLVFILLLVFILVVGFISCRKDFDKIIKPAWKPELAIPFIKSVISLNDLIEPDSTLIINPDNSIKVVYANDSLFSADLGDGFDFPEQDVRYESFSMGSLTIDNYSMSSTKSLFDILPYIIGDARDSLIKYEGTTAIFPPFAIGNPIVTQLDTIGEYVSAKLSQGTLKLTLSNNLPVAFDHFHLTITDPLTDSTIADIDIYDLGAGQSYSNSVDLSGKTIGNTFRTEISELSSPGSYPDSVLISFQDTVGVFIEVSDLKVVSGEVIVEDKLLIEETKMVDFTFEDSVKLFHLSTKTGRINYAIYSNIPVPVFVRLRLPSAQQYGDIPIQSMLIEPNIIYEVYWDLELTQFNLTTDPEKPYNRFPVEYKIETESTGQIIQFDSSNSIILEFQPADITFSEIEGYLGEISQEIDTSSTDLNLSFMDYFEGGFTLSDPEIHINYINSAGIPLRFLMELDGIAKDGITQSLNLEPFNIQHPDQPGHEVSGTILIDKTNSSIIDFIGITPRKIRYGGMVYTNPDGQGTNFLTDSSMIRVGVDIDLPIRLQTDKLLFEDTVNINMSGEDITEIEAGKLHFLISNGFPFDVNLDFVILDKQTGLPVEIISMDRIHSAPVNESGKVSGIKESLVSLNMSNATYRNLKAADKCILRTRLSTVESGTIPVALYTNYTIGIDIGIEIQPHL